MEYPAQDLYPCSVALCPKTLQSKAEFEEHVFGEHCKKNNLDVVVSSKEFHFDSEPVDSVTSAFKTSKSGGEFDFVCDDDEDESGDVVRPGTISPVSNKENPEQARIPIPPTVVLSEVNRQSSYTKLEQNPIQGSLPDLPDGTGQMVENLKSGFKLEPVCLLDIKTEEEENEHNVQYVQNKKTKQFSKRLQSNVVHRIGRMQETLIRNKSAFTIQKIEALTKITLSPEAKLNFETLINEGRDQEIYSQIFGNIFCIANLPSSVKCRSWICRSCPEGKFLGSREDFEEHFKILHHGKLLYTCELCNKTQKSFRVLKVHLKSKHFTDAKCERCAEIFPTEGKLLTHKLNVHGIGGYQCDQCSKMCPSMARLKVHVRENHSGLSFSCSTCMKVFKTKGACVQHEATHSGRVYECEYCIDTFISETGKAKHVKFQHTLDFEKFTCEVCGKEFGERTNLTSHMKFHQKHEDLICEICGKLFNKMYAKRKHKMAVHDNIRSHACDRCDFRTTSNAKLKHHIMKTHENQQEVCFLCNQYVKHPYQHVRSAHADKPTAWKEYMERKKVATKLLKSRAKPEDLKSPSPTKHIPREENGTEVLPSDFNIYPNHW